MGREAEKAEQDDPGDPHRLFAVDRVLPPGADNLVVRRIPVDRVEENVQIDELRLRSAIFSTMA
jgi:hypothetical protein